MRRSCAGLLCLLSLGCLVDVLRSEPTTLVDDAEFEPVTLEPLEWLPSSRIVGGQIAAAQQFPHQVSLREDGRHICGGSIISQNYIVTAAHCISDERNRRLVFTPASRLSIRAGSTATRTGGVVVDVAQVVPHPQYVNFANDIALLRLTAPLSFSGTVKAIPLAVQNPPDGAAVTISGWGRVRSNGPSSANLQYNVLTSISNARCRTLIGRVPTSVLCLAHRNGNGACQGDSGGPGVYNNTLVGITNFVVGPCGSNAPDGYANVASFVTWLRQNSDAGTEPSGELTPRAHNKLSNRGR